jgi:hypothetical protein
MKNVLRKQVEKEEADLIKRILLLTGKWQFTQLICIP